MMRWAIVVSVWIAGAVAALPAPVRAQTAGSELPVSLDRIRAELQRPPSRLQTPTWSREMPTFRVSIDQPMFTPKPVEEERLDPTMGIPSAGELLMGGIGKLGGAIAGFKRRRAQGRAKQEVDDALSAFCAVHECPAATPRRQDRPDQ